jgi:hypothetical protein
MCTLPDEAAYLCVCVCGDRNSGELCCISPPSLPDKLLDEDVGFPFDRVPAGGPLYVLPSNQMQTSRHLVEEISHVGQGILA